jgi:hypothetical protein
MCLYVHDEFSPIKAISQSQSPQSTIMDLIKHDILILGFNWSGQEVQGEQIYSPLAMAAL